MYHDQRLKFFNNQYGQGNKFKASWRSLRGNDHKNDFLKSGFLDKKDFTIKIKSVGNLIRTIEDLMVGKNTAHEIHEYKYFDYTYYMNVVEDAKPKENERKLVQSVNKYATHYESVCWKSMSMTNNTVRINLNSTLLNFQNYSSNINALTKTFKKHNFIVLPENAKKKKGGGHGKKKEKEPKTVKIAPRFVQIEAALYLGKERISEKSYSQPRIWSQNVDFDYDELSFYRRTDRSTQRREYPAEAYAPEDKPKLKISNLPSNTRLVLQIILLPETLSMKITQMSLPNREGFIYGSVCMPLFDLNRRLKQGNIRLLAWPLQKFDERYICMSDCYKFKEPAEIAKNFNNNLDLVIEMPKFHTDVFWDLGKDVSLTDTFQSAQKGRGADFRDKLVRRNQDTVVANTHDMSTNASVAGGKDQPNEIQQVEQESEQI